MTKAIKPKLKTPISYYGGKQTILPHILPLIPKHTVYTETFCGGCAVLFAKEPVPCEIINDTHRELINFYRVAQIDGNALKREIDTTLHSRDLHTHARHIMTHPQFFTPVQRAWAVWVGSKTSFASKLNGPYGYDRKGTTNLKLYNAKENFTDTLCQRLSHISIESEDAKNIILRYDSPEAFHFVDPPYVNSDCGHYTGSFSEENFAELLDILSKIEGKFMLTMYPHELLSKYATSHDWKIHKVHRTISASRDSRRKQEEWMVCNYTLPGA